MLLNQEQLHVCLDLTSSFTTFFLYFKKTLAAQWTSTHIAHSCFFVLEAFLFHHRAFFSPLNNEVFHLTPSFPTFSNWWDKQGSEKICAFCLEEED